MTLGAEERKTLRKDTAMLLCSQIISDLIKNAHPEEVCLMESIHGHAYQHAAGV